MKDREGRSVCLVKTGASIEVIKEIEDRDFTDEYIPLPRVCQCVCVCRCVRERERAREREQKRERASERASERARESESERERERVRRVC